MEEAIFISRTQNLKYVTLRYKRLYFGNEFCERLIPELNELKRVIRFCDKNRLDFSLVTPYLTNRGLAVIEELFIWLQSNKISCEVIVNDYGLLDLLNEKYRTLQPVLGRLLSKQKRDPRIARLAGPIAQKKIFYKFGDEYYFVLPKRIPPALVLHYKKAMINTPIIQDFLMAQRVKRVELDNLLQGINPDLPKGKLSASLYLPYGYITTTRLCSANPFRKEKRFFSRILSCKKECQDYTLKLKNPSLPRLIYKKGNTLFFKNAKRPALQWLKERGIDRLVYQPEIPV